MLDTADLNPRVERAYLIGVYRTPEEEAESETLLEELKELVSNLGIDVVQNHLVKLRTPNPGYLLGKGKLDEILHEVHRLECDVIVFDEELTPAQQRNWEKSAGGKVLVIDRQEVILDIFNDRAQTKEARLQVELARLEYELPRMRRAWSHLSRQRGGGVTQRDAGETQLEIDQRLIRNRIARLKRELVDVTRHREIQRRKRMKVPLPTAAIVGYTNAGKSSLLNRLTEAHVIAEDKLFATLDPTTRRTVLPSHQILLLTDTVGFIRKLPHRLIQAFKATLEEAVVASFLIHVVDASSPEATRHMETTLQVLEELGAEKKRIITVFNKIDRIEDPLLQPLLRASYPDARFISVKTGEGIPALLEAFDRVLDENSHLLELLIPHDRYDLIHRLHDAGAVTQSKTEDEGIRIQGRIPPSLFAAIQPYIINQNCD